MSTTHDAQVERYREPYAEPPKQQIPTTHDLQAAAAQGDSEAGRRLELYAALLRPAMTESELRDAVSASLAGTKSNT